MDVIKAIETYVSRMVEEPTTMKVLLLDADTTPIVSLVTTQSTLLSHQIYLTDRIDNRKRDRLSHLKCICFLRPVQKSLESLAEELHEPHYGEYYLCQSVNNSNFSNTLTKTSIERLAEADRYEVVKEVKEMFADYAPILPSLFTLNHYPSSSQPLYGSSINAWHPSALERAVQGLLAVLLSLRKKPLIRYERISALAKKLGNELHHKMEEEEPLFDFRGSQVPPLLLIVDRRNDPVTPLLTQWTYQAMVHELLGIQNGRVNLSMVPDIRPELKEIILTRQTDPFFEEHYLATFGELGGSLKDYVQSYQLRSASHQPSAINSITDMKRFIEEYPEFQKLGGNVSKHVALVGELSRLVERDQLLEVGECEQSLATSSGCEIKTVQSLLLNNTIPSHVKLRLVMLYALHYQKTPQASNIGPLVRMLLEQGVSPENARLVYALLNMAGTEHRQEDLFAMENLLSKGRSVLKGIKGVENVYTQHTPRLAQTLEQIMKGRLKDTTHPFLEATKPGSNQSLQRPHDIIVFMIGGVTYEEARVVALLNKEQSCSVSTATTNIGTRILLGGTCIHNSSSYLEMLSTSAADFPPSIYSPPSDVGPMGSGINLQVGNLSLNVGGSAGSGIYRTSGEGPALQTEGIRDGVKNLMERVKLPSLQ